MTGCVNTALAQVLRYYRHPAASQGVVSYVWNGQRLKAILYRSYTWENMPDVLDATTSEYQVDEAARLIADLGIANETNFGLTDSGASIKTSALTENFGYSTALAQMTNADADTFFATLKTEIDAERPVLLSFPGHMVVADGYTVDDAGRKIHINMGWGGSHDNFYVLDQSVVAGGYTFNTTAGSLSIYYNIKPCNGSDCAVNLEAGDALSGFTMTGAFNASRDTDRYDVYLKGATSIQGTRGYSNLAFFISLHNQADGSQVAFIEGTAAANTDISAGSLPAGKYRVQIGLCNASGTSCFQAASGNDQYTVTIVSSTPTAEEKAAIDQTLEMPPVINNTFRDILLDSANPSIYRILVDARDENDDAVTLQILNSNPAAFQTALNKNIIAITPASGISKVAGRITVRATAGGRSTEKSFVVMASNETVGFGQAFELKGVFENQDDFNLHQAILDGACTIRGDRGYYNHAFYTLVQDNSGATVVAAKDETISGNFAKKLYRIGASLKNAGYQYTYSKQYDQYILTVHCPDADDRTTTIAALLGIDLSGLQSQVGDINGDGAVTLADAILALRILAGMTPPAGTIQAGHNPLSADINVDGRISLAEVIYILQKMAEVR